MFTPLIINSSAVPSEAPQNLQAAKVTTHSVTLKWEAPPVPSQNGAIIGYTIQVLEMADNRSSYSLQISKEPSLTVTNLEDDTTYNFSVAANTSIGAGPYTIHVTAKTKNYGEICDSNSFLLPINVFTVTALEVVTYLGISLLLVLMVAIMGLCVVCYHYRSQLKQFTSKW